MTGSGEWKSKGLQHLLKCLSSWQVWPLGSLPVEIREELIASAYSIFDLSGAVTCEHEHLSSRTIILQAPLTWNRFQKWPNNKRICVQLVSVWVTRSFICANIICTMYMPLHVNWQKLFITTAAVLFSYLLDNPSRAWSLTSKFRLISAQNITWHFHFISLFWYWQPELLGNSLFLKHDSHSKGALLVVYKT